MVYGVGFCLTLMLTINIHAEILQASLDYLPWYPNLKTSVSVSEGSLGGTEFSHEDVGINDKWILSSFRLRAGLLGSHFLTLSIYPLSYEGNIELNEEIEFKGHTYSIGDRITSKFSLSLTQIDYTYYPIRFFGLKPGLGAAINLGKIEASIQDTLLAEKREYKRSSTLPIVYIHLGYELMGFEVEGWMGSFFKSEWGTMNHNEIQASYSPFKYGSIGLGYRYMRMSWDLHDSKGSAVFSGLYLLGRVKYSL